VGEGTKVESCGLITADKKKREEVRSGGVRVAKGTEEYKVEVGTHM